MPYYPPPSAAGGAPSDATYITQTANGTLSSEQNLAALSTGLMVSTTTTGVVTTVAAPAGTVVGTSDVQTLTNKTLSDTFMGKVFDTRVTARDVTLGASTDYIVDDSLENSGSFVVEVPATSTLEVVPFVPISTVSQLNSGWVNASGTWTFVSSTTMTVPIADANNMSVGTKIQLFQSGIKYFYVTAIAGNLVTVNGGTDYTLASAAITSAYFSNFDTPVGFPQWFNYTPTWTGFSAAPSGGTVRFCITGRMVNFAVRPGTGTSSTTAMTLTLPVTATAATATGWTGTTRIADGGAFQSGLGIWQIAGSGTTASVFKTGDGGTTLFTASSAKVMEGIITYEI